MAIKKSKVIFKLMKKIKPLHAKMSIDQYRKGQDRYGKMKNIPKHIVHEEEPGCTVKSEWFRPTSSSGEKAILYLHGGAYVSGGLAYCRALATEIAHNTGIAVIACEYRLAPEFQFPSALEDAAIVYDFLLRRGFKPEGIAFVGESAGAGLALALGLYLRDNNKPLPAAIACFSAWTDLTITNPSYEKKQDLDPTLSSQYLKENALLYAGGEDLKGPYISPFYGDYTGLPPILLQAGTNEITLDDSQLLYNKIQSFGVDVSLEVWDGMWHVFQLIETPEALQALGSAGAFLRRHLKSTIYYAGL